MNLRLMQLLKLHGLYQEPADEGKGGGGGSSSSEEGGEEGETGENNGASKDDGNDGEGSKGTKPSDAEAKLLKDLMKQKRAAEAASAELTQVKEKLSAFDGLDVGKVKALLAEAEAAERKKLEEKGEYDRLLKQMGETHKAELARIKSEAEAAAAASRGLQSQISELTVGNAFATSKFVTGDLTLTPTKARVIYGAHFEFKDTKIVGYDKPAGAADRTPLVDGAGETLSFEDAMKKIIDADPDRDQLLRSKVKPGAGSSTTSAKGLGKVKSDEGVELSGIDKIARGLKSLANKK